MNKSKLYRNSVIAAMALLGVAFSQTAMAAGGYTSSATTPSIYSPNTWSSVSYSVLGSPSSSQKITTVYYNWSYQSSLPSGLQVLLCDNSGNNCHDVSRNQSGSVNFSSDGISATTALRLYARVNSSTSISALYGGPSSVTVNYQ